MRYDINVLIRDLPEDADNIINTIALLRGKRKWEITREALIEYADRHKVEIARLVSKRTTRDERTPSK